MFLSCICMPVSWASESFWKMLHSYPAGLNVCSWAALWLQKQSFIECHLPFFLISNFRGRPMRGCLIWVLNFIFAFTNYPFLLVSVLSLLPEKALLLYILAEQSQGRSFASDASDECLEYPHWLFRRPIQLVACGPLLFHRVILASSHMNGMLSYRACA